MLLWIAQGFGVGRIPFAPGTFGSLLGILLFLLLAQTGSLFILLIACVAGFFLSVWSCGAAERVLGRKDPGSVVMDEIAAIPVCFLGWAAMLQANGGRLPSAEYFLSGKPLAMTAALFVAFRVFDIAKPWPVRQSQDLPGGWGITCDDFLAAGYVNLVFFVVWPSVGRSLAL
jgi:phosphatidylglycerophosphatase A